MNIKYTENLVNTEQEKLQFCNSYKEPRKILADGKWWMTATSVFIYQSKVNERCFTLNMRNKKLCNIGCFTLSHLPNGCMGVRSLYDSFILLSKFQEPIAIYII